MAQGGDFLARIKLALEGKEAVVSGLQQTQAAAQQLSKTKVITIFDPQGVATGRQLEETFTAVNKNVAKAKPIMEQFGDAMKRALIVAPVWMIIRGAIQAVTQTLQNQIKFLIDFETAITRIKIVGKGTEEEYKKLSSALVGLAYAYGTTASEAADAALIFAQQGRTVKETIELTRAAMLASKILGTDIKTAVDDMTGALEGFQLGIEDATSIVDKWINVEKQFAVTSKDLADATKVAGASAHQLGITMSEFLGDVTAAVEVTRKSGSEVARGLSFIYARLLTSGKETVEQITKIPFYLDETGKSTNAVGTQLRSVSSILEELASKWGNLTKEEKLEIATALGSKRQMVILNALMQNYNASLDARIAALTSAGSAEKAFALIQDTTAFKIKQVGTAWNVLTTAIGDTSSFKSSLNLFDRMIINLTALINYEKAYGALHAREVNKIQLANETRLNEIKSLEELISVRDKLAKAPQIAENIDRLKKVQDAIDAISAKESKIKIVIDTGSPEELKKAIEARLDELTLGKITLNVSLEFEPKIASIEKQIEDLQRQLQFTGGEDAKKKSKELSTLEVARLNLYREQAKVIAEQYKIQKGQQIAVKGVVEVVEEEEALSSALTEKELERVVIQNKLNIAKESGIFTNQQLLDLEIQGIKNSLYTYDIHEKTVKLAELEGQRQSAIIKDLEKKQSINSSILKLSGQLESSVIRQEMASKMLLYGENYLKNSMEDRVKLAEALTNESLAQEQYARKNVELFKIAQKYGIEHAQDIAKYMAGGPANDLSRNTIDILEKENQALYEQVQAERYFSDMKFEFPEEIERRRRGEKFQEILKTLPNAPVSIQSLQVNVSTTAEELKTAEEKAIQIQIDIAEAIRKDPNVKLAIREEIENY
jgi:TP901 family phage tail tape measure protein